MARILVIEDNPDNLELMTYLLKAFGHTTLTAEDGELGIALACSERPDLIVCDVHLPKADGYEVARRLKADPALAATPLLAVTALAMVGDRDKVLAGGFDGYLTKPIDPQLFIEQMESYLPTPSVTPAPTPVHDKASASVQLSQAGAQLLVIDDIPSNRELLQQILQPSGYRVRLATSIEEGLALARQVMPELILCDQQMPGADGFAFLRQIKAQPEMAQIPVLFLSSSTWGETDRETALRLGAARFILRPIEPQYLLDEVASCLHSLGGAEHGAHPDR